jgi:acyl-CoA thioester hydrolase
MQLQFRVRFHELDPYGHVNHGVYLNWFETARIDILDSLGFGLTTLRNRGIHLVVTRANLDFLKPAVAGDTITIHTEITDLRRATSWWHQRAIRGDETLAQIAVRSGTVDAHGTPMAAPPDLLDALRSLHPTELTSSRP